MNKGRLIWGIVCLAIAGLLAVLNLTLPPDKIMFTLGEENRPWVPPVVLGALGAFLAISAIQVTGEAQEPQPAVAEDAAEGAPAIDEAKVALNKRLETAAWGLFLIMLGGFAFVPDEVIPGGLWSIGVGLILLGLNLARYLNQIKMSGFTTFLGVVSVIGGILELVALKNIEGAVLIIVLGAYLIIKPYFDRRKLFGKAEES